MTEKMMSEIEKVEREIAKRRELRRALFRWVAAIREALVRQITHYEVGVSDFHAERSFEAIKRDLNQCERMLHIPDIDYDPVLEIWRKDTERAGVLWFNFAPPDSQEQER